MASWKDYLYFTKAEKRAIIVLLLLIVIVGTAYILTQPTEAVEAVPDTELMAEFEKFKSELKDKPSAYPQKLKEGQTIEINSADTSTLKTIPGIGPAYASRIIKYRNSLGGFTSVAQLKEVWGLDDELYEQIATYITIEKTVKKVQINNLSLDELRKHPYISYKQAKIIVDIRTRKGDIKSVNRLALLDEFTEKDIKRLTPYLRFD
jgi:competence ComEA-like helix-hairpin-helix protein